MAKVFDCNMPATFSGAATFTGAVDLASTLEVAGVSTFTGAVDLASTLEVAGAVSLTGAVDLASTLEVAGISTFTGAVDLASSLEVAGVATFTGAVSMASTLTATGAITASGGVTGDVTGDLTGGIVEVGTGAATMKCKVIEIGDWDMVDGTGTDFVDVAHGLTLGDIRDVRVVIRNDDASTLTPINGDEYTKAGALQDARGSVNVDATNVSIRRIVGGLFDHVDWNSTTYNRGWITIWYEA